MAKLQDLKNKVVWITGASSGIGAETAKAFAAEGAAVILTARNSDKLTALQAEIGGNSICLTMDVTSNEDVMHVCQEVIERYGKIDVLVNNAGFGLFQTLEETSMEEA